MLYLAWDIDGTLLLTNRAGYDALQEAICDYFFRKEPYQFQGTQNQLHLPDTDDIAQSLDKMRKTGHRSFADTPA